MAIFHREQERDFTLHGNHIAGLATASREAQNVEVWRSRMDAGAATPPHQHDYEEVIVVISGRGRATIGGEEVTFQAGDTLILPPGKVHQIFSETDSESIVAIPRRTTIRSADGDVMDLPWRS